VRVFFNNPFVYADAEVVPKTILEMMNVEGLRREHVASHLQVFTILCTFLQFYIPVACLCFGSMCVHVLATTLKLKCVFVFGSV
jgi:hypothetical protein